MQRVIQLTDGPHKLSPPSYYAFSLLADFEVDAKVEAAGASIRKANPKTTPEDVSLLSWNRVLPEVLAAVLTDSEPLNDRGEPAKVWGIAEAAKLIPVAMAERTSVVEGLSALVSKAQADKTGGSLPPTRRRGGAKH